MTPVPRFSALASIFGSSVAAALASLDALGSALWDVVGVVAASLPLSSFWSSPCGHRDADADDHRGDHRDRADQQALGVGTAAAAAATAVARHGLLAGGGPAREGLGGLVVGAGLAVAALGLLLRDLAVRAVRRGRCLLLAVLPLAHRA